MAIYSSIALGRAKKSIGNVTFLRLKGQNIAKAKIVNPTNPSTDLQVVTRNKMRNIVAAWKFLQFFFLYIGAIRTSVQSNYNVFVHLYKNLVSGAEVLTGQLAAISLFPSELVTTNTAKVIQGSKMTGYDYEVAIDNYGFPFPGTTSNPIYCIGVLIDAEGNQKVLKHTIGSTEWLSNTIDMDFGNYEPAGGVFSGFYLADKSQTVCSNILLMGLPT
jgi:hypothetical protein